MRIATSMPSIKIVSISDNHVEYISDDGRHWEINGQCNGCGECWVGATGCDFVIWTGLPIGEAGACYDKRGGPNDRLDIPIMPDCQRYWHNCTLSGRYLNGN